MRAWAPGHGGRPVGRLVRARHRPVRPAGRAGRGARRGARRARLVGDVRGPVPRGGEPCAAAAPPAAGPTQPLWQQRQRSAQLLSVASEYPDFPILLEAARECLQDDFDTDALVGLMRGRRRPTRPRRRGHDHPAVALRPVAALRVHGPVPLRRRRPARRAPRSRPHPRPDPAGGAAGAGWRVPAGGPARPRRGRAHVEAELSGRAPGAAGRVDRAGRRRGAPARTARDRARWPNGCSPRSSSRCPAGSRRWWTPGG